MKGSSTPSSPPPIPGLGFVPGCPSFRLTFFTEGSWNRILKLRPCPYYPIRSGGVELPPVSQPRSFRDSRPKRTSLHSSGCKRTPRYPSRVSSSMTLIRVVTRATSGLSWDILIKTPVNYPARAGRCSRCSQLCTCAKLQAHNLNVHQYLSGKKSIVVADGAMS